MPALMYCRLSPEPGWTHSTIGVGDHGDVGLRLADADGLDDHPIVHRAHQHDRGQGLGRETAEPAARRHRAHEHTRILGIECEADAIAQQRAAALPRRRVDRDHADAAVLGAQRLDQPRDQGRLADAGRAGQPDHLGSGAVIGSIQECDVAGSSGAASMRASARAIARLPPARSCSSACGDGRRGARDYDLRAARAAARRAIGTR